MVEKRNTNRVLVEKPEGKIPLGKSRRRWGNNIKTDLKEIGWESVEWINLADVRDKWRAVVNTVMNLHIP
jgi:hypothetical protein